MCLGVYQVSVVPLVPVVPVVPLVPVIPVVPVVPVVSVVHVVAKVTVTILDRYHSNVLYVYSCKTLLCELTRTTCNAPCCIME